MERPDAAFYLSVLPAKLRGVLEQKIKPEETILWAGQPNPVRRLFTRTGQFLYGIFVAGGVLFLAQRIGERFHGYFDIFDLAPLIFPSFFAVFFLLISVILILSPLFAFAAAKNTVYAVTNQRALSMVYSRNSDNEVIPALLFPEGLKSIARKDGTGTLLFFYEPPVTRTPKEIWHDFWNTGSVSEHPLTEFSAIKDVRKVEELIRKTLIDNPSKYL